MYTNVSSAFLTALQRPSRHFAARFTDNGTAVDLEVKHIKANFGSCGSSSLAVGCAFSSYIEVTANRTNILLEGKELFLEIGLLLPDETYEYVPFGYWTVQKPTKTKDSMAFQAVDRMSGSFNAAYETELTYPATAAAVLAEFATKTGIPVHCSLQTSAVTIATPIEGVTQRAALSILAATLLGNAWIDRNGEIQITAIGGGTQVEINYDYVKTQPEMDEEPTVIEGVRVYTVEGQTDTWIERGSGNQVTVSDVYMTDANLDVVKGNVIGLAYGGGSVSFMGNPLLDPSDIIKFRGGIEMKELMLVTETAAYIVADDGDELVAEAYDSYEVPCMDIVQEFDGGLLTTVTAPGQFEKTESTIAPGPVTEELARQASAINSAQTTANNAVTLANGKNKIFYQDEAPATGMAVGDMWFDTNGGNAIYEYKSTGWTLRQLGQGSLAANSVTAVELYVSTLSAITANIGEVTAGVLKSSDYSYTSGTYAASGMIIDLNNKVIRTPKTAILSDGSIYSSSVDLEGKITATSGKIGGWEIDDNSLLYDKTETITGGTLRQYTVLDYFSVVGFTARDTGVYEQSGYNLFASGILELYAVSSSTYSPRLDVYTRMGTIKRGTEVNSGGVRFYSEGGGTADYNFTLTASVKNAVTSITRSGTTFTATRLDGTTFTFTQQDNNSITGVKGNAETSYRTGNVNLTPANVGALALTGGTLSGSVLISATGKGYNLTDASGTSYGGLYENGDNLWIGAASSTSPHHRGAHGNTYISAGYSTNSNAGNGTIYISVPSLSGGVWSHAAYGVLHAGNYGDYALPRSGGVLTGNLVVGQLADTVDQNVTVRNSLGNVAINVSSAGNHGLYSSTKGGWIIYCNPEANSVNSLAVIPRPLYVTGNFASTGEVHAGGKDASSDGKTGSILSTAGHLYMQATSGSHIYFYYGTSTSVTSQLYESASGTLRVSGDFTIDGVIRVPSTWSNTTTNSANVRVIDQYGQLQRYTSSSRRYKHSIKQIKNYRDVLDINVVTFVYNKDYLSEGDPRYDTPIPGFIAEDVAEKYPIAADVIGGKVEDWNARYIIPPMLAVEQDHERRIAALEAEIKALKGAA